MRRSMKRSGISRAQRIASLARCEVLEDRRLLAAVFRDGEILVQFDSTADAAAREAVRSAVQGRLAETIGTRPMRERGFGAMERIAIGKGMTVGQAVATLTSRPGVLFAEPDYRVAAAAVSNDPFYTTNGRLWGLYGDDAPVAVGPSGTTNAFGSQAEKAWGAGSTGSKSVVVGIIDEGVDVGHPDLAANMWINPFEVAGDGIDNDGNGYADDVHGWDFVHGDNTVYDAGEDSHGTHVAGTIGGVGGNGLGVAGVNWNVSMISMKFLGPSGGYTSDAIKALDYLTDLKLRHGVNVVAANNSWGGGGYSSALHAAIIRGANAGILFVAAAGNGGSDGIGDSNDSVASYPANYSSRQAASGQPAAAYEAVIAVAALTSGGGLASYSNYGATTVDIAAPGSAIWSTLPGGTYGSFSGTSMAAPHVTGAVALYAAAYPAAGAATTRSAILDTVRPTAAVSGKTVTGGRLDVAAALQATPPVAVAISGGSSVEGDVGTTVLSFTVSLSAAAAVPVTVNYATASGTATAGVDFASQSGTLAFAPGETAKTIAVEVFGDGAYEGNETVVVSLSAASVNAAITTGSATGTILNDDAQPAQPTLTISSVSALEGSGAFVFTVSLSGPSTATISVRYATSNGTATAGRNGDYTATSGTLSFSPGQTSRTIAVNVRNDATVEAEETFFVSLSRASGATIAVGRGTGTIRNDDGLTAAAFAALAADAVKRPAAKRR